MWLVVAALAAAAGLASVLAFPDPIMLRAQDEGQSVQTWTFAVVDGETEPGTTDRLLLDGTGTFNANEAEGRGRFTRFNSTAPQPPVAFGTYEVTHFQSFTPTTPPTYGAHAAGVLIMTVDLHPDGQPPIRGATLKVVCNQKFAGLSTGQVEGAYLTLPDGTTFQPLGGVGTGGIGVTLFGAGRSEN
jgi:hypothetical protein